MGMFSGLFRSRDKSTDSTIGSRSVFYMGGTKDQVLDELKDLYVAQ